MSNSIYAQAINEALGVTDAEEADEVVAVEKPQRKPKPVQTRVPVANAAEELAREGDFVGRQYRGFQIAVHEHKVAHIWPDPGKYGYWEIFFYTDEELRQEKKRGDVMARMQICKAAIDRYLDGKPVFKGQWHERKM